jgi:hypothetical protein
MVTKGKTAVFFRLSRQTRDHQGEKLGCSRARVGGHFSSRKKAKSAIFGKSRKFVLSLQQIIDHYGNISNVIRCCPARCRATLFFL